MRENGILELWKVGMMESWKLYYSIIPPFHNSLKITKAVQNLTAPGKMRLGFI